MKFPHQDAIARFAAEVGISAPGPFTECQMAVHLAEYCDIDLRDVSDKVIHQFMDRFNYLTVMGIDQLYRKRGAPMSRREYCWSE